VNPLAEALTGWREVEARGRPLADVFRVVEEETRRVVTNPVDKILESAAPSGLTRGTVLVAQDGTATPIDDSAAPIRGERRN
jgi:PAS domain-containing protein